MRTNRARSHPQLPWLSDTQRQALVAALAGLLCAWLLVETAAAAEPPVRPIHATVKRIERATPDLVYELQRLLSPLGRRPPTTRSVPCPREHKQRI